MRAMANDQRINAAKFAWVGARNASQSIMLWNGKEVRRNLFNNPDAASTAYFGTANGATRTLMEDGSGILITCIPNGIAESGAGFAGLTAVGSTAYTLSVEVEAVSDCNLAISIQGNGFSTDYSREWVTFSAGEVKPMNKTGTSLAAGGVASPYIIRQKAQGSEQFKVRKVMWEAAPTARPFFSGDTLVTADTLDLLSLSLSLSLSL